MAEVIKGMRELIAQLKTRKKEQIVKFKRGMFKAGLFLQGESQKIAPVDKGNMRASAFTRVQATGTRIIVTVGYTAAYAIYVHEDLELRHGADYNAWYGEEIAAGVKHSRGENQQAKFLEQPARTKRKQMAAIIREESR